MENKKGFTLIELLGVIVILAIIALIATPIILGVIEKSRQGAFKDSIINGYDAVQYKLLEMNLVDIPDDGISISELKASKKLKGNLVSGSYIKKDGKIFAKYITDGKYCAYGELNNLSISTDCNTLDPSAPIIYKDKVIVSSTSNNISITLAEGVATDDDSNITSYKISLIQNGNIVGKPIITTTVGTYKFEELKNGTNFEVIVVAINGAGISSAEVVKNISTKSISEPTYSITPTGWTSGNKTIAINYPDGYTNEYSIDGGITWTPYTEPIIFTENGTIIARVTDGKNEVTSSQLINEIDRTEPTVNLTAEVIDTKTIKLIAACVDEESGISKYEYSNDNGSTFVDAGTNATYTFDRLTTGTYNLKLRCTNGAGTIITSNSVTKTTEELAAPTFSVDPTGWSLTKNVTITYPTDVTVKQYSFDGETWKDYDTKIPVTYDTNTIFARSGDGVNYKVSSETVVDLYLTTADKVTYTPADSSWSVTTVQEAVDYLLTH